MVDPSSENSTITAVISSQPFERSRLASAATAVSRALVENDTEMKAPMAMMKKMTPIWPNRRPTVCVSTNPRTGLSRP